MLRPLVALVGLALVGCGAADRAKTSPVEACPSGVPELGVRDILPAPPAGMEIVAPDRKTTKPVEDAFRKAGGDRIRSIRSRVVVKRGRAVGTLAIVINADERMNPRDILLGARDAEVEAKPKEMTIAGENGVLLVSAEGATAAGAAGDCSAVTLFGPTEAEVRAVAEKIQRPE